MISLRGKEINLGMPCSLYGILKINMFVYLLFYFKRYQLLGHIFPRGKKLQL